MEQSLQERYAPHNACFGCGPANAKGLHIRSFVADGEYIATWQPEPQKREGAFCQARSGWRGGAVQRSCSVISGTGV